MSEYMRNVQQAGDEHWYEKSSVWVQEGALSKKLEIAYKSDPAHFFSVIRGAPGKDLIFILLLSMKSYNRPFQKKGSSEWQAFFSVFSKFFLS